MHQIPAKGLVLVGIALCLAGLITRPTAAQSGMFNERDDQYRLLGLKRAKAAFEIAREGYQRQEELHGSNMVSDQALADAKRSLSDAEVNYQQSLLAVLFEQQYVAVMGAVKYQDAQQRKRVRLQLENTSGGGAELKHLIEMEDELFRSLRPDLIHDVYVSLTNEENAIISQPYEAKIEELRYGEPVTIDFVLLQDVDSVTVQLAYGNSAQRSAKIFLQKDQSVDQVVVQSEQFSQEVELSASTTFDLSLELFSGANNTYKLEVVGLPPEIHRYFVDPASGARLSQFKFTESTQTRRAGLQVFLPDRDSETVTINESIPFWVLVIPGDRVAEIGDLRQPSWDQAAVDRLDVGTVRLEIVPRGVGRLRVKAPMLYFQTDPDAGVAVVFDLINEGTRRLDNIELSVDPPLGWAKELEPAVVPSLGIGEEKTVRLTLTPPADAVVGKYETRIRTSSYSDDQPIEAEDKTVTVEIRSQVKVAPSVVLILVLICLILGIVIFGVRLTRR